MFVASISYLHVRSKGIPLSRVARHRGRFLRLQLRFGFRYNPLFESTFKSKSLNIFHSFDMHVFFIIKENAF